jgi:enterochelin esterase-like enzyme
VFYQTHAYATDKRDVMRSALVYLPAGYDENKQYNILYLLHGSGDDQYYWLRTHEYNKIMLDNMIAAGEIEPLIVVTPTFYCEDDCTESVAALEGLTYAFRDELRNDLMPAVESKYSTYAGTADEAGFTQCREHRAFAGLSRGAVTTNRSVLCGCLDYFAWFGTFSGSRTSADSFLCVIIQWAIGIWLYTTSFRRSSERKGWMNKDFLELDKNRYLERYFDPRPV